MMNFSEKPKTKTIISIKHAATMLFVFMTTPEDKPSKGQKPLCKLDCCFI